MELLQRYYEGSMTSLEESDDISMSEEANVVADEVSFMEIYLLIISKSNINTKL